MGCHWSQQRASLPKSPLQLQLQQQEAAQRAQQQPSRRQEEKRQRQLAKLQQRNAKKRRRRGGSGGGSIKRSSVDVGSAVLPQLRLLGGSNGSSATECISELYARTLEQQRMQQQRISSEQQTRFQLEQQLQTFVLNQLVLVTQFLGHPAVELAANDEQQQQQRRDCAQRLTDQTLLHASAVDAAVAKRLQFKPIHGPHKSQSQPLQMPLTYIVFENVDIARPNEANYDSIACATLCKLLLETNYGQTTPCRASYAQQLEHSRWQGYVRLKLREPPLSLISEEEEEGEAVYTDASSGYSSCRGEGNGNGKDDGDYDYVYLTRLSRLQPLEQLGLGVPLERNVLPASCVSKLARYVDQWMQESDDEEEESESSAEESSDKEEKDEEEEERQPDYETIQVLRQCRAEQEQLQQTYLNSSQFMRYFGELLRQQLATHLSIRASQLQTGSYRGCSVQIPSSGQLVPAIHVPHLWPDCAFEFNLRARPLVSRDAQPWPTAQMRKRIQSFGYHVVPMGYTPKRRRNPFRELEWRIIFPQAEQFLERHLKPGQLKLLLLLQTLVKSFVEPHEKAAAMGQAVTLEQLRAHIFWQSELQPEVEEQFLGEALVRCLRNFASCLARKHLPDYFIAQRNLFEHVPEDALMALRGIMAAIAEQPLMHLLMALRNLQHAEEFYPKLDHRRIYENLVEQDYLQLRSWAKFARQTMLDSMKAQDEEEQKEQQQDQPRESSAQGLLGLRQHQERTRGKLRRKTQLLRAQQQQQQLQKQREEQRRDSLDSISLDLELLSVGSSSPSGGQLNDGVEILRRTNLLELLLDHLLAMIGKANEFRNAEHGQLYLEQAQLLCRLYKQLGCGQNAQFYAQELIKAASELEKIEDCSGGQQMTPPALPRRSSQMDNTSIELNIETTTTIFETTSKAEAKTEAKTEEKAEAEIVSEPINSSTATTPSLTTLLQRLNVDPKALQSFSVKTEQLMQTFAPEAKREELRDMLKRNAQRLKGAFNQMA